MLFHTKLDGDDDDAELFLKNGLPLFLNRNLPRKMRASEKHSENIFVKP